MTEIAKAEVGSSFFVFFKKNYLLLLLPNTGAKIRSTMELVRPKDAYYYSVLEMYLLRNIVIDTTGINEPG